METTTSLIGLIRSNVIPPRAESDIVLYCTKKSCLHRFVMSLEHPPTFGAVGYSGLPPEDDLDWMRSLVGKRRLLFWGDADPGALLVFAWLRDQLPIEHIGMSDRLLSECRVAVKDSYTIELGQSEVTALPLITECLGDLTKLLGPACAGLLSAGRKIEMEVLLGFHQCTPKEMESALLLRS